MKDNYVAAENLSRIKLTCANCNATLIVDAGDNVSMAAANNWFRVVPADGIALAFHDKQCAIQGIKDYGNSEPLVTLA